MQDLSSRKEVMAQAVKELSEVEGIKVLVLHCQLHGVDKRKKIVSRDLIYSDFPLIRVLITYQYGKKRPIITQSRLVYPNNVYPYGRKTLEVLEDIARQRYVEGVSWKVLGDIFYEKYDFSLENLKRSIIRVNVVFNRLLNVGLIQALKENRGRCVQMIKSFVLHSCQSPSFPGNVRGENFKRIFSHGRTRNFKLQPHL